ncbi:MAG: hypothetical protein LRY73_12775 [Bacillus sp. (in: Bacteria)]|nr:hypothetical protein [Bacillus sp. (in: firmicutes)]
MPNVLEIYHLSKQDIANGIRCPDCGALPMLRMKGIWICPNCSYLSTNAHLKALEEYVYLYGTEITNKQLREFLQLPSRSCAKEILKVNCKKQSGKGNQTIYHLSDDFN